MVRHAPRYRTASAHSGADFEAGRVMKSMVLYLHVYCIFSVFTLYLHLPFPGYAAYFACYTCTWCWGE